MFKANILLSKVLKYFDLKNSGALIFGIISLIYFVFSAYYFYERLYGDSAYYLFKTINNTGFFCEHNRPASIFIQIIPKIALLLNFDLKIVIWSFSFGEWLYFFLCGIILYRINKNWNFSIGMYLILLTGILWNYFNPVSELILGIPLVFFIISVMLSSIHRKYKMVCIVLLTIFLVFSHSLFFFVILYLLLFLFFGHKIIRNELIGYIFVLLLIMGFRYYISDDYDKVPITDFNDFKSGSEKILKFNFSKFFKNLVVNYLGTLVITSFLCFRLISTREWKQFLLFSSFCLLYTFIVIYKYGHYFPEVYEPFERYLILIPIVTVTSFYLMPQCQDKKFGGICILIAGYHFFNLYNYARVIELRCNVLKLAIRNTEQFHGSIFAYNKENFFFRQFGHDWMISLESALVSAAESNSIIKQIFIKEFYGEKDIERLNGFSFIYYPIPLWIVENSKLNNNYFKPDNTEQLIYANTSEIQSNYPVDYFKRIKIVVGGKSLLKKDFEYVIPISIYNTSDTTLASGKQKEQIFLSYHWYDKNGNAVIWEGIRTPILTDVKYKTDQLLIIKTPPVKGKYKLCVDVIFEGIKWADVECLNPGKYDIR